MAKEVSQLSSNMKVVSEECLRIAQIRKFRSHHLRFWNIYENAQQSIRMKSLQDCTGIYYEKMCISLPIKTSMQIKAL